MSLITRQAQAVSSLSKPSQRARDCALSLADDMPWEDYLSPAPMCIAILGQLQLVATKGDFSIRDSAPISGFQHVKCPDSFRACLVQVTNNGWNAFNTAHTKMNQVKLLSGGMPDKIETIFKILVVGTIEEVQQFLLMVLSSVSCDAQKCETLAKAGDAQFLAVVELTSELLEVCTNQEGLSEQKLQQAEAMLAANKNLTDQLAKQEEEQAERVKNLKEASKKAEELFNETVKKVVTCNGQIKYLTEMADEYANMRLSSGGSLAALGRDFNYNLCVQLDAVAHVVTIISSSHVDVSTNKIAALDAATDGDQIRKLQQELLANMTALHAAFVDDVVEQKKGLKREIDARAKQVDQLGSLLPPAPADIKQQVQPAQQTLADDRKQIEQQKEQTLIDAGLEHFF
ncbi:hypothetical protein AMAG_17050 [Allomyces macrogynus ATCC 38327]|uniref:Uncharacterized protein n=1 Tax=Allomyces macrogynus (strain ATCC 38327) TaxID=578462 RepID=A0A0L0TCZ2_ALLM3|nr:hypothetical protein AMAG_17050 [Allomyces macrogynus ATCC 38327]|eukprot:KNE72607.1 hypothetical protein AMAG_17050 [Allomyces macrogynus ATCC 38327]